MELSIRSLFTAAGMMLLSSLTVIPAASAAGKAVHPTVDLPNGQWLNFHQKDNQVWSEMSDGDAPGVHLDDYGTAEIVAVFTMTLIRVATKKSWSCLKMLMASIYGVMVLRIQSSLSCHAFKLCWMKSPRRYRHLPSATPAKC